MPSETDHKYLRQAITLAEESRGITSPNPFVGAVIVQNNQIVGQGKTQPAGQDHAEIQALKQAGGKSKNATLYVTLEPCCHYGQTPPCTQAIIKAGISKVIIGIKDPNPAVNGQGITELKQAGIEVKSGFLESEIRTQNEIFIKYITTGLPFVCLKTAASLDGKITAQSQTRTKLSGPEADNFSQKLRQEYDAILVGSQTIQIDNPRLTNRQSQKQPIRIIPDQGGELSGAENVFNSPGQTILVTAGPKHPQSQKLTAKGVRIITNHPLKNRYLDLEKLFQKLAQQKISSILIEGGSTVNANVLRSNLVDKIHFIFTPLIIGGKTTPSLVGGAEIQNLADMIELKKLETTFLGRDLLVTGRISQKCLNHDSKD